MSKFEKINFKQFKIDILDDRMLNHNNVNYKNEQIDYLRRSDNNE